jgi:drug/metabolite transporter (DMT)-like permease
VIAVALGLGSSLLWGLADFAGGVQARRAPLAAVVLVSQATGLVALVVVVAVRGVGPPSVDDLWPAALAGAAGAAALGAFYHGLAIGQMSIVAPISATGATIPVAVGVAGGDRPSGLQAAGVALAVAGVVLASRQVDEGDPGSAARARRSVAAALVAAVGFGTFFVGMSKAAHHDVYWALLTGRAAAVVVAAAAVAVARPAVAVPRGRLAGLAAVGALDVSANALYAYGSTRGLLSIVAVLGSLYPVVTVLLARAVLHERVRPIQDAGVLAALAGVALIAGG